MLLVQMWKLGRGRVTDMVLGRVAGWKFPVWGITNIIQAPDSSRMNLVVGRPSLLLGPFLWVLEVVADYFL